VPAELPQTLAAYRLQQKRWTQGWAQLQRLHLGCLLFALPHRARAQGLPDLPGVHLVAVAAVALWIATLPFLMANGLWLGALGTGPPCWPTWRRRCCSRCWPASPPRCRRARPGLARGSFARRCARIVPYLVVNTGMVPHHVCAFIEGLFGPLHAEFERTPKTASVTAGHGHAEPAPAAPVPSARPKSGKTAYLATEAAFCAAQLGWIAYFIGQGMTLAVLGASWVISCVVALRLAPTLRDLVQRQPLVRKGMEQ
jgi:hypothetical protein